MPAKKPPLMPTPEQAAKRRARRMSKDRIARFMVTGGGLSVIVAVCMIFVFLMLVVVPLFDDAKSKTVTRFSQPNAQTSTIYMATEEKGGFAVSVNSKGLATYFSTKEQRGLQRYAGFECRPQGASREQLKLDPAKDVKRLTSGDVIGSFQLPVAGATITAMSALDETKGKIAFGLSNGAVIVTQLGFAVCQKDVGESRPFRVITPNIVSVAEGQLRMPDVSAAITSLAISHNDGDWLLAVASAGKLHLGYFVPEESGFDDEDEEGGAKPLEYLNGKVLEAAVETDQLFMEPAGRWLFALDKADESGKAQLAYYLTRLTTVGLLAKEQTPDKPVPANQWEPVLYTPLLEKVVVSDKPVTAAKLLNGGYSLLFGDTSGRVSQWFPIREGKSFKLHNVRDFTLQEGVPITALATEMTRKGFFAGDKEGNFGIFYTTSKRTMLKAELEEGKQSTITGLALSRSAQTLLATTADNQIHGLHIENEHPDVSWGSLWNKVWYEGDSAPSHKWQSTGGDDTYEAKLGLTPLAFGTFKAALYAMALALPLAIFGALYTGYFMSAGMRKTVKPLIEIMEALPTVILGFLAGLWLAPKLGDHMMSVLLLLVGLPFVIVLFGYLWDRAPKVLRHRVPEGWNALLLVPLIAFFAVFCFQIGGPAEQALFDAKFVAWLAADLGIEYDQRNCVVVGLAMGFAVIPTIFSIAEDAVFGVPKSLSQGSLALGATQWQTMVRVILPTASPGIFSAVMIGFGRAVGETMIVLMATGNTAILDWDPFNGARTFSANIATEMPEAEVDSTHYRLLFLSGLVLFIVTFAFNTIAEIVRQRLRKKYQAV